MGCIRIIDESGEDYLYPAERFAVLDIPLRTNAPPLSVVSLGPRVDFETEAATKRADAGLYEASPEEAVS